jgi:hypothetical protein
MPRASVPTTKRLKFRRGLPFIFLAVAVVSLLLAAVEAVRQHREDVYVRSVSEEVLRETPGSDPVSRVAALRDFVRGRVRNQNFSARNRPFLRDTAAETLRSGKGRCGEATRVFVNLAAAAGIRAQRLYLEGSRPHVVAVVSAEDGSKLLVDSFEQPYLPEIEPLEGLARHKEFTSYSTFGWRRSRALRALPAHEVSLGPLNYLLENPHALLSFVWLLLAASMLVLAVAFKRRLSRVGL